MQDPSLNRVISDFYNFFSNESVRKIGKIGAYSLFAPEAHVYSCGPSTLECWTLDEFIEPRLKMLSDGTITHFREWEDSSATTILGAIATRVSDYRKEGFRNGAYFEGRGRKLMHLCRTSEGWRIVSLLWQDMPDGALL